MKYYWSRDRRNQKQFKYIWDYGDQNEGDYWTKHHPTHHHKATRPQYIKDKSDFLFETLNLISHSFSKL